MGIDRTAGIAATGLAVVYVAIGVSFFLLPSAQQATGGAELLASLGEDGVWLYATQQWLFVASGLLGFAIVAGFHQRLRPGREGPVTWASALGYLGFAVTIVEGLRMIDWAYDAPEFFRGADQQAQFIIAGDLGAGSLDPTAFLGFGAVGAWLLVICVAALVDRGLPRGAAWVGVVTAGAYWLVAVGTLAEVDVLITVAAAAAIVVAPVFYWWAGRELRPAGPAP